MGLGGLLSGIGRFICDFFVVFKCAPTSYLKYNLF